MNNDLIKYLQWLKNDFIKFLNDAQTNNVILGISGGIDSTLTLAILNDLKKEYDLNIYAYFLDIHNSSLDYECINELKNIYTNIEVINLVDIYDSYCKMINKKTNDKYVLYNLKPKIRTNYLYAMANAYKGVVVSNLNYDEYILGFFTKYGDSAADYYMLIGLLKKHIYELGAYYHLPNKILNRAPTPANEDDEHKTDESFFGFTYNDLDQFLLYRKINPKIVSMIKKRYETNAHKHFVFDKKKLFLNYKLGNKHE
ncbi:NAD(+) synthase [Ureaplasma parvum]|uniref:NAD(+) synthase n=1 Tax=Ureaplasma parvum TaxID=134821 RepID=UPI000169E282|nr:NAD(+) synthase [Ureaplasma parvum]EDU19475.1 NAD+ synthetase [Ureaplasma parvum serovar 6 str. ATCC 27818]QDI64433.1 NAD(+) synthase [Ureaplasma parvum]